MLALDSPRWGELRHSYSGYRGCQGASNVPDMLRRLEAAPDDDTFLGAWYDLMEAVYREGWDFWSASYAVVPHLVRLCEHAPLPRQCKLLLGVGSIEAVRRLFADRGELPHHAEAEDLIGEYEEAVSEVPRLVARCARQGWGADAGLELAASLLLAKGLYHVGEGVLRLRGHVFLSCPRCGTHVEVPRAAGLAP